MKTKKVICLLILVLIIFASCDNDAKIPHEEPPDCAVRMENFRDFDSFAKYASNPETQTEYSKIDPKAPVDFGSIIPNEEILCIDSYHNFYDVFYKDSKRAYDLVIRIEYDKNNEYLDHQVTYDSDDAIENTDMSQKGLYKFTVNGTKVYYTVGESNGRCENIKFIMGEHYFFMYVLNFNKNDDRTDAQKAFIEAFFTEEGTADMLERIKALLPQE